MSPGVDSSTETGISVDANIVNNVRAEIGLRGSTTIGPIEALFNLVVDRIGLALNDHIIQEWKNACGEQWVNVLLPDFYLRGRVIELPVKGDNVIRNQLRTNCGLPANSKDFRYVACAKRISPYYVWSGDIDLYDPADKSGSQSAKTRARKQRRGLLWRYVKNNLGVTIGCYCHLQTDLGLSASTFSCPPCHDVE